MGKDSEDDEDGLWEGVTKDVKPLKSGKARVSKPVKPAKPPERRTPAAKTPAPAPKAPPGYGLDRRTDERLRRGQMKIEARLDLHGYGLVAAEEALKAFIVRAYGQGLRCVLVITGKGKPHPESEDAWYEGAPARTIREQAPGWLAARGIGELILKTYPAQVKDGGTGALYVLLRRQREP